MGNFLFRCPKLSLLFHVQVFSIFVSHTAYCLEYHLARESNNNKTKFKFKFTLHHLQMPPPSPTLVSFRICHFSPCTMSVKHWWRTDTSTDMTNMRLFDTKYSTDMTNVHLFDTSHSTDITNVHLFDRQHNHKIWLSKQQARPKMKVKRSDNPGH